MTPTQHHLIEQTMAAPPPVWPHLVIGDGVGHVGWVDHGRDATQKGHGSVDQSKVVFFILQ